MAGLVLCSHGTRSEVAAARISALVAAVAAALPSVAVREAHVDVHPPYVEAVAAPGDLLVPLLLARGHHVDVDIARAAHRAGARVTPALGPDDVLTVVLEDRLARAGLRASDVVVLAAAGSSSPGSDLAVRAQAAMLSRLLRRPVHVGYGASARPLLGDVIPSLRNALPGRRILAASYLLAPGHFHDRVAASGVDLATAPLLDRDVPERSLVELVVRRYLDAWLADTG